MKAGYLQRPTDRKRTESLFDQGLLKLIPYLYDVDCSIVADEIGRDGRNIKLKRSVGC